MRPRHSLPIFCLLAGWIAAATGFAQEADLIIGMRADAPPFSSLAAPREEEGRLTEDAPADTPGQVFTGYMANICTSVVAAMREREEFSVYYTEVTASDRFTDLQSGKIDVLCDPATIDRPRLAHPYVLVSPPVYLSGVGVAEAGATQWQAHWPCIGPVVGVVKGTTASRAIELIAERSGFGVTVSSIVQSYPSPDKVELSEEDAASLARCAAAAEKFSVDPERLAHYADPSEAKAVHSYFNHQEMAAALCRGDIYYSVGDLEIVAQALAKITETDFPDCNVRINPRVFSEERYGIFVHISDEMNRSDRLALAFLRQLSIEIHKGHESVLVRSFADNFDRTKISRSLDMFLWSVVAGAE